MNKYSPNSRLKFSANDIPKEAKIPEWLIEDILPKNKVTILSAGAGTGKTSLCAYLAQYLYETKGTTTLYWAFEDDPEDFTNKVGYTPGLKLIQTKTVQTLTDEYGTYEKESPGFFNSNSEEDWEQLRWLIREKNAGLLIIDPITQLYNGDINDGNKVRHFMIKFVELAKSEGIAILLIHHNRKDPKAGANNAKGSATWTEVPRHHLSLGVTADNQRRFLEVHKTNMTERGLSWEIYSEVVEKKDSTGRVGKIFSVTGMVRVENFAVTNINKDRDNTPLVVKKLKEIFEIGRPFNLDDVCKVGSYTEFNRWKKANPTRWQEIDKKKDGKKAWIFI